MPSVKLRIVLSSPLLRERPGYRWFCYNPNALYGGFGDTPAEAYADMERNNG